MAKEATVTVSEGIGSLQSKLSQLDSRQSLDQTCHLQRHDDSSLRTIEPQLSDIVQRSAESIELLQRNTAVLDDLQSVLNKQMTSRFVITQKYYTHEYQLTAERDLEPIIIAINAVNTQITQNAPKTISTGSRSGLPASGILGNMNRACVPLCNCSCHKLSNARSPPWLQPVVGALSLKYSLSLSGTRKPCSSPLCHSRSAAFINVQYQLPLWLAARAIFCSLSWRTLTGAGASLWVRVPRIVDIDLKTIFESSDIENTLSTLRILPTDIDQHLGLNLLTVSENNREPFSNNTNIKQCALESGLLSCLSSLLRFGTDPTMPDLCGRLVRLFFLRLYLFFSLALLSSHWLLAFTNPSLFAQTGQGRTGHACTSITQPTQLLKCNISIFWRRLLNQMGTSRDQRV